MNIVTSSAMGLALICAGRALTPRRGRRLSSHQPARRQRQRWRRQSRAATIDLRYADAIELIVLAVRAGHLPLSAIRTVHRHMDPEVGDAFAAVLVRTERGDRFADALSELPRRLGNRAHTLADGLAAADRDGLPLAPVLDRLADDARLQRRLRADAAARQLPVRLSLPLVLCTLPSFVLLAVAPLLLAALTSLRR
jgi:tight adherence protein C